MKSDEIDRRDIVKTIALSSGRPSKVTLFVRHASSCMDGLCGVDRKARRARMLFHERMFKFKSPLRDKKGNRKVC